MGSTSFDWILRSFPSFYLHTPLFDLCYCGWPSFFFCTLRFQDVSKLRKDRDWLVYHSFHCFGVISILGLLILSCQSEFPLAITFPSTWRSIINRINILAIKLATAVFLSFSGSPTDQSRVYYARLPTLLFLPSLWVLNKNQCYQTLCRWPICEDGTGAYPTEGGG